MDPQETTDRPTPARPPDQPRGMNLAAVAGGVVLIGLMAFALYRRSAPAPAGATPAAVPEAAKTEAPQSPASPAPATGALIAQPVPVRLSPEASVLAERYRCICSCNDPLGKCTCSKSPGSNEMKTFLQKLVDKKLSGADIDKAMIEKWGPQAVISAAPTAPRPTATKR